MVLNGLTTPLTIYGFGLRGNSVAKSIRKHRFRTEKPEKARQIMQKIRIGAFGTKRPLVRVQSLRPLNLVNTNKETALIHRIKAVFLSILRYVIDFRHFEECG